MSELTINKENFEAEVLNSDIPVLLDFWADWCGPCQMLAPVIGQIAQQYAGRLKVGKVNVDQERELAAAFRVMGIPTIALIKDGKIADISTGYRSAEELSSMLDRLL